MRVAFDTKLVRPGCALLQAAFGGTPGVASLFPNETWLLAPTPDLHLYELTDGEMAVLATMVSNQEFDPASEPKEGLCR